ncbi:OmpA family protein [Fusobacterium perfoetens]|uniref:OmpA family protein n=1 Tax=Fusobacterium perfoetens TaxID=852 RepID=UPI000488D2D3|nr:OmpA family protein [Fusobacterium perfoetens]MCI6153331.1 OmpA family protein [Fusobacterium perfoetens]MDY3237162.1 OmpA family protein [Fusobacterium perfoetens]
MKTKKIVVGLFISAILISGCTSNFVRPEGSMSYTSGGALSGAAAGALAGQLIGGNTKGTLIGTAAGALIGTAIGAHLQQQENEFRNILYNSGVEIINTGSSILLNIPEGLTFNLNSSSLKPQFIKHLDGIATVLNNYPKSNVIVTGHTDSTGSREYNMTLSQKRALTVGNYLVSRGVAPNRFSIVGKGPDMPIASNSTLEGRKANRRVTIEVLP